MEDDYYLGLDLGVGSVGWAVTDKEYNILKLKGKRAWGARLFKEANTNLDRRSKRIGRRNLERRKNRIKYLNEIFEKKLDKVDRDFLNRLQESKFQKGDKKVSGKYTLFNDTNYNDKDYHKDFPTIYHLRKHLINGDNQKNVDVRHFYIAISHILKHRGHFLRNNGEGSIADVKNFDSLYEKFEKIIIDNDFETHKEITSDNETINVKDLVKRVLISEDGKNDKKKTIKKIIDNSKNDKEQIKKFQSYLELMVGSKVSLSKIFGNEDNEDDVKIELSNINYDEKRPEIIQSIGDENILMVDIAHELYDYGYLFQIVKDKDYISDVYIDEFNKQTGFQPKKENLEKQSGFVIYKKDKDGKEIIDHDIRTLRGAFGRSVPMQLHKLELEKILENATFLNGEEKEKIKKIFSFKIPYYCGPLTTNTKYSENSWLEKNSGKEKEKIRPWNFDEVVNKTKTAEKFIKRMVRKCTYLYNEICLPKNSIYYKRYMVLNTINNIKIGNERISDVKLKQDIYNELFLKEKSITKTKLKKYLEQKIDLNGNISVVSNTNEEEESQEIPNLKSEIDFREILKDKFDTSISKVEEAIEAITVLPDDKEMLLLRVKDIFNKNLADDEIRKIANFSYVAFGNFSKKLLTEIKDENGKSILDCLYDENNNFMELLYSKKHNFQKRIDEENSKNKKIGWMELLENSYASNPVKRAVIQTMKIVDEIIALKGKKPSKVFIEFARENQTVAQGKTNRTKSRFKHLSDLYKNLSNDNREIKTKLKKYENDQTPLRSERLFLYFLQAGKCLYCGNSLDIDNLSTTADIDHIVPQSMIKDDSFDNKVLVHKEHNTEKGDIYPLPHQFRQMGLIEMLKKAKLLTQTKYWKLVKSELTEKDKENFLNRQLVETSQIMKLVKDILNYNKEDNEKLRIVAHKAGITSNVRSLRFLDLPKLRMLNNHHHAKDAYLAVCLGNIFNNKIRSFQRNEQDMMFNIGRVLYKKSDSGKKIVKEVTDYWTKEVVWNSELSKNIISNYYKNDCLITVKNEIRNGGFYGEQLSKASKNYLPQKTNDDRLVPEKYGGYKRLSGAFIVFISYKNKKDNLEHKLTFIPIIYKNKPKEYLKSYVEKQGGKSDTLKIIHKKIPFRSLLRLNNGYRMIVDGFSGDTILATNPRECFVEKKWVKYLKKLEKMNNSIVQNKKTMEDEKLKLEVEDDLKRLNEIWEKHKELMVNQDNNYKLFELFIKKLKSAYKNCPFSGSVIKYFDDKNNDCSSNFKELHIKDQIQQLLYFIDFFNGSLFNCKLLGGMEKMGSKLGQSYLEQKDDNVKPAIIRQSITGLLEKKIPLYK